MSHSISFSNGLALYEDVMHPKRIRAQDQFNDWGFTSEHWARMEKSISNARHCRIDVAVKSRICCIAANWQINCFEIPKNWRMMESYEYLKKSEVLSDPRYTVIYEDETF